MTVRCRTLLFLPFLISCSPQSRMPVGEPSERALAHGESSRTESAGPVASASWGNEIGNGGGVVVCGNEIELIDFAQALTEGHRFPELGLTREDYVSNALNRLRTVDAARAKTYEPLTQNFISKAEFVTSHDPRLQVTFDFGALMPLPTACHYEMVAFRRSMVWGSRAKYLVREDNWEKMNALQQAGLILHEIIGEESLMSGDEVSENVRSLVAFLFREEPPTPEEYAILRKSVFSEDRNSALTKSQILLRLNQGQDFALNLRDYLVPHFRGSTRWEGVQLPEWVTLDEFGFLQGKAPSENGRYRLRFALKDEEIEEGIFTVEIVVGHYPVL